MALSTLSRAMRPCLFGQRSALKLLRPSMPMATTADEEMKKYWEKNQRLNRPNSPWVVYKPQLTTWSSLAHRVTGVGLGLALYGAAVGMAVAPGDITVYMEAIKGLELGPLVWFPTKVFCSFPIFYHSLNGIRHLYWDFKGGYEIREQNKSAILIFASSLAMAMLLSAAPYLM